jgi:hypothetical protein
VQEGDLAAGRDRGPGQRQHPARAGQRGGVRPVGLARLARQAGGKLTAEQLDITDAAQISALRERLSRPG